MNTNNKPSKVGDCESCTRTNVILTMMHGNIEMCDECVALENKTIQTKAQAIIKDAEVIDSSIRLKSELFNVPTVAAIELRAAIDQNDEIPSDKKNSVYIEMCSARFKNLTQVIFDKKAELDNLENERRVWQINIQTTAGKLRSDERAKYKEFDLNYQPVVKTIKPTKVPTSVTKGKSFSKQALVDAAKKYDVPLVGIQSLVVSKNLSVDDAAKQLAKLMGKL